jgi:hypothetical protein
VFGGDERLLARAIKIVRHGANGHARPHRAEIALGIGKLVGRCHEREERSFHHPSFVPHAVTFRQIEQGLQNTGFRFPDLVCEKDVCACGAPQRVARADRLRAVVVGRLLDSSFLDEKLLDRNDRRHEGVVEHGSVDIARDVLYRSGLVDSGRTQKKRRTAGDQRQHGRADQGLAADIPHGDVCRHICHLRRKRQSSIKHILAHLSFLSLPVPL